MNVICWKNPYTTHSPSWFTHIQQKTSKSVPLTNTMKTTMQYKEIKQNRWGVNSELKIPPNQHTLTNDA